MNKNIKAIWTILIIVFATSCNKPDDSNSVGNNNQQNDSIIENSDTINIHDYVDLGLPSGTLWATCNVGADTPEGFGDFLLGARPQLRVSMLGRITNTAGLSMNDTN